MRLSRVWQQGMIALAKHPGLTRAVERVELMRRLSGRFVGGRSGETAVARATALAGEGLTASLFYLGEYVAEPERIEQSVVELIAVLPRLAAAGLEVHASVDPTQAGSLVGWSLCEANVGRVAQALAAVSTSRRRVLMLDMEDSGVTEPTLQLHRDLKARGFPAAVTVQAYLRRSEDDVRRLVRAGATVRLVKGALAEPASVAYTARDDIDRSYAALIERLLSAEAKANGVYPAFGTHDERMMEKAQRTADANGWEPSRWELEMLLGVRPALQRRLVAEGRAVRLYLPFGERFWPYTIRRVGENPRNLAFVMHSLFPS